MALGVEAAPGSAVGRLLVLFLLIVAGLVIAASVAYVAVVSQNPSPVGGQLEIYGT